MRSLFIKTCVSLSIPDYPQWTKQICKPPAKSIPVWTATITGYTKVSTLQIVSNFMLVRLLVVEIFLARHAHSHSSIRCFFDFFCTHFFYCIAHRLASFRARLIDVKPVAPFHDNLVRVLFYTLDGSFAAGKSHWVQPHVSWSGITSNFVPLVCSHIYPQCGLADTTKFISALHSSGRACIVTVDELISSSFISILKSSPG